MTPHLDKEDDVTYGDHDGRDLRYLDEETLSQKLWSENDDHVKRMKEMESDDHYWLKDHLEDTYNPTFVLFNERIVSGIENDKRFQQMYLELEYFIENVISKPRVDT